MTHETSGPSSWAEAIGPVIRKSDLPDNLATDSGLMVLTTSSGTEVCPDFQFETTADDSVRKISPGIASAWLLLHSLQVEQLGEGEWTKAAALAQPRQSLDESSWASILKDPLSDPEQRFKVFVEILLDANNVSELLGIDLRDPRTMLPE